MQVKENTRKLWLDASRGMAMILVVLIHILPKETAGWPIYNALAAPVMIPLFFAVTGYVFKTCDGKQGTFFKGVFFKLIVPWFFLSLLPVRFLISFLKGPEYFLRYLYLFVSGNRLWYIPCCIVAEILHFYVRKFARTPVWVAAGSAALCAIGFWMIRMDIGNFGMANRAFIAQAFILVGYLYRVFENRFQRIGGGMLALCGGAYVLLSLLSLRLWTHVHVDVHLNAYGSFLYFMIQVLLGCLFVFAAAKKIKKLPGSLVFLGQNTYVCYALHGIIIARWDELFVRFCPALAYGWISSLAATLVSSCFCCVVAVLVNRYVPFVAGKRSRRGARG